MKTAREQNSVTAGNEQEHGPAIDSGNDLDVLPPTPELGVLGWVERGFLLAGLGLFAFLVHEVGLLEVLDDLGTIGFGFVPIIAQEFLAYLCNALGWRFSFPAGGCPVPFARLLAARIAGDAINNVTPTATIGGEFIRARMVRQWVTSASAWASVTVARIAQSIAQVGFVAIGLVLILPDTPLPEPVRIGLWSGLPLLSAGILTAYLIQRRAGFVRVAAGLRRKGLPVPRGVDHRLARLDSELRRFHARPWRFLASVFWFLLGWALGVVEIFLILWFLGLPASWTLAFKIEVFSVLIDGLFFFVPLKAGTQEGGKWLIFSVLGLDPAAGVSLGIARRVRELAWAGVGLTILSRHHIRLFRNRDAA